MERAHWFVVPRLDGPISGGTLYNRELLRALDAQGVHIEALDVASAEQRIARGDDGIYWVDSLYLDAFATLSLLRQRAWIGLIAHYLPSLVTYGAEVRLEQLSKSERTALQSAQGFLAPSAFMKNTLERLGAFGRSICVVEPGHHARVEPLPAPEHGVLAVMVGNVLPGKRILPFLEALAYVLPEEAMLRVNVLGSLRAEPDYAEACQRVTREHDVLSRSIVFHGAVAPESVKLHLSRSNVFLSASAMEAYGMALAEARAVGVPIIACRGGNVSAHVVSDAGGLLVDDPHELASACVWLCQHPEQHAASMQFAERHAPSPRTWSEAARDFRTECARIGFSLPVV